MRSARLPTGCRWPASSAGAWRPESSPAPPPAARTSGSGKAGGQQSGGRVTGGEPGEFPGGQGAGRSGVVAVNEPDVGVQDVVQTQRDEHPVGEAVGERAERPGTTDEMTHRGQAGIEDRV